MLLTHLLLLFRLVLLRLFTRHMEIIIESRRITMSPSTPAPTEIPMMAGRDSVTVVSVSTSGSSFTVTSTISNVKEPDSLYSRLASCSACSALMPSPLSSITTLQENKI